MPLQKPGDTMGDGEGDNPLTEPFFIDGGTGRHAGREILGFAGGRLCFEHRVQCALFTAPNPGPNVPTLLIAVTAIENFHDQRVARFRPSINNGPRPNGLSPFTIAIVSLASAEHCQQSSEFDSEYSPP